MKTEILPSKEEAMAKIGLPENEAIAVEVADKAITLVKNNENIFPISPEKTSPCKLLSTKWLVVPNSLAFLKWTHSAKFFHF